MMTESVGRVEMIHRLAGKAERVGEVVNASQCNSNDVVDSDATQKELLERVDDLNLMLLELEGLP